jgi:hypothetical protein
MNNKQTTEAVLKYVRTGRYTIHDIRDMCNIDHPTFHRIVKKAGYPRPSTQLPLNSSRYMSELKSRLRKEKTLFPVSPKKASKPKRKAAAKKQSSSTSAADRLWGQLEDFRLKASKRWIEDQIKVNTREAKALRSLKHRI